LINSIRHRNQTLELVLGSIVKKQRQYFLHGDISMAPLTMNEVAEDCGVHESTVSRISSSKVVQTPYGMLSIKEFFCSSINTDDGSISSRGVKKIIKSMISEEIITKPISDMYITNELNQHGINISRRTVAKYRSAMNIPSSSSRIIKLKKQ
jgi:RNA polymerase sigma-54 factor